MIENSYFPLEDLGVNFPAFGQHGHCMVRMIGDGNTGEAGHAACESATRQLSALSPQFSILVSVHSKADVADGRRVLQVQN